jgi:hypothetical protein
MKRFKLSLFIAAAFISSAAIAQEQVNADTKQAKEIKNLKQNVRGYVIDAESKQPLTGVVVLLMSDTKVNALTDDNGYFILNNVPVGRQSFQFSTIGYEKYTAQEVMVISGKELELNAAMKEELHKLDEVTVSAVKDRAKPMNEFAAVSARSFSVEETRRYAASIADPARMAMNFPGVSNSGDNDNSIVVRGNSPKGILWRLEGVEIPNPNHFSSLGATGGAISMLNANVLGTSDFYTGAFPPEIGNALAGAFDLNFRNGNTERREHTVQIGTLGAEVGTEGPFKEGKKASYLINYRYSTFELLSNFIDMGGVISKYQDASMKLNFPTEKAGTFTVFGLGGVNTANNDIEKDSSKWTDDRPNYHFSDKNMMGIGGVSHQYFIRKDAYIKTILSGSYDENNEFADTLNPADAYRKVDVQSSKLSNTALRLSVLYNEKLSARHTIRTGIIAQQLAYDFNYRYYDNTKKEWRNALTGNGSTQFYQAYMQWKARLTERLTLVSGLHGSYFALNSTYSIEPRASLSYQANRNKYTLAAGMHSKPEHVATYLFRIAKEGEPVNYPNKNLELLKSVHTVAGYETNLPAKVKLKAEIYYQYLYDIPVDKDTSHSFSMLNAESIYSLEKTKQLVSEGTGQNYGIDISLERPFINNYYVLATGSLYKSTYVDYSGKEYNTRFNRGYQVNLIGGKEFIMGHNSGNIIGLNGKILYSGGMRESLIDVARSVAQKETVYVPGKYFSLRGDAYFRADASIYYKMNRKKATHTIQLDIQNVTNHENHYYSYFDTKDGKIKNVNQLGFIPNITYRIDFHW